VAAAGGGQTWEKALRSDSSNDRACELSEPKEFLRWVNTGRWPVLWDV